MFATCLSYTLRSGLWCLLEAFQQDKNDSICCESRDGDMFRPTIPNWASSPTHKQGFLLLKFQPSMKLKMSTKLGAAGLQICLPK